MARVGPVDAGSVQAYENFTGGVVMALAEHGIFAPGEANEFMRPQNLLAPDGRLPLNTSGGNLAECCMHGFELVLEAVRQVRGQSTAPAARPITRHWRAARQPSEQPRRRLGGDAASAADRAPCLPPGLPAPLDEEGVNAPFWQGLAQGVLRVQRCAACGTWQFGGEWLCHPCHAFDPAWVQVAPRGRIFSWERVWHPVAPGAEGAGALPRCAVELPHAGGVRVLGNLLGDGMHAVPIGAEVAGIFEHHRDSEPPYALLQWRRA